MRFIYNITILFLFSSIYSCTSTKSITIDSTEEPFYTTDSVFLVTPSYQINNDDLTLGLELEKMKDYSEYYFPSSEELRVIIKDTKGKTILNTAESKSFMTAISPVEPQEIGGKRGYIYSLTCVNMFDGQDEIDIYMILPTKPIEIFFKKRIKLIE